MDEATEHVIRERAYQIWENEGRPDGKHAEHWRRAVEEVHGLEDLPRQDGDVLVAPTGTTEQSGPRQNNRTGGKT